MKCIKPCQIGRTVEDLSCKCRICRWQVGGGGAEWSCNVAHCSRGATMVKQEAEKNRRRVRKGGGEAVHMLHGLDLVLFVKLMALRPCRCCRHWCCCRRAALAFWWEGVQRQVSSL